MAERPGSDTRRRAREQRRKRLIADLRGLVSSSPIAGRTRAASGKIWRSPVWLVTLLMAVVLIGVITVGAFRSSGRPAQPAVVASSSASETPTATATPSAAPATTAPATGDVADLEAQVSAIEARYGVQIGLAITGVSPTGTQLTPAWTAGSLASGPALGTIDVPMGVAVLGLDLVPNNIIYLLDKSISESSLSGDEALYSFLGSTEDAAAKTTDVLRAHGDATTTVATTTTHQGVPAFTQTDWSVTAQAQVASQLWCSSEASFAVSRMHFYDDDHSYGFGKLVDAYLRTDDGTDDAGNPVIRQMAIVPNANGDRIGVGMVITGAKDQLDNAKAAADAVAGRVYYGAVGFDAGHC